MEQANRFMSVWCKAGGGPGVGSEMWLLLILKKDDRWVAAGRASMSRTLCSVSMAQTRKAAMGAFGGSPRFLRPKPTREGRVVGF